jgi:16S rRNA (guanine966-N2)-methyltransferase
VRVIAGSHRGRLLRAPAGLSTRPTGDRVREAIFDVLGSMMSLEGIPIVEGASILDLFAGSGAMGIEALSRGAARAVFVESDPAALEVVRGNLAALGLEEQATVVRAEAVSWLASERVSEECFDLALCDPPYSFDAWADLLGRLHAAVAVLESSRPLEEAVLGARWELARSRRYGGTLVTVVRAVSGLPVMGAS